MNEHENDIEAAIKKFEKIISFLINLRLLLEDEINLRLLLEDEINLRLLLEDEDSYPTTMVRRTIYAANLIHRYVNDELINNVEDLALINKDKFGDH